MDVELVDASKVIGRKRKKSGDNPDIIKKTNVITRPDIVTKIIDLDIVKKTDVITRPDIIEKTDIITKTIGSDIARKTDVTITNSNVVITSPNIVITNPNIGDRTIRAIKLNQDIYYGPKNVNKNKFVRMYKKLGLTWTENISVDGIMADGWFNKDRSQYIIKLMEDGDYKRFKFYGCDDIYDYFLGLGGVVFDHTKENSISANYLNNEINNKKTGSDIKDSSIDNFDEYYRFVGPDLWSGYRTRQLLKNMPDNWGVIWK